MPEPNLFTMPKHIHENSRKSYEENERSGRGRTYRQKILELLTYTNESMTDRAIIDTLGVEDVNNIRPEITRLKQEGYLVEDGKTKCPHTGKTVRTVKICPKMKV
jgi:predicted HTH transcriptional regulator